MKREFHNKKRTKTKDTACSGKILVLKISKNGYVHWAIA